MTFDLMKSLQRIADDERVDFHARDTCVAALDEIERLRAGLTDMFALIDECWLVRNTDNDPGPGWAMRQIGFVQRLAKAQAALTAGQRGET